MSEEDITSDTAEQKEDEVSMDDWAAAMGEQADAETTAAPETGIPAPKPVAFEQFGNSGDKTGTLQDFDMILDIPVALTVELGRTKISIRNLLQLAHGSVVELDGLAGEPMDVLVNGTLIAQGEVVVVNDKFGIRLTDIITPQERIKKLNR
ncbi:MAG TPA: flagellar motor switch protein FliN [Rhodocyclaceae bacterium]|nr:flagellar motor switch protein FliN [Rhodocyclaceae bacterium]